jgi:hypothetical protein
MTNRFRALLAAIPALGLAAAVALWAPTDLPPHVPNERRTSVLATCATDWQAWAVAWCPEGDAQCIDDNNDHQGRAYCVDGVEVGQCALTQATPSQEARAVAAGVLLAVPDGWTVCPEVITP